MSLSFDALVRKRAESAAAGRAKGGLAPVEIGENIPWDSYAKLVGMAAAYLQDRGIGKGDRVAVWGQTSLAWAVWLGAAAWRGAAVVAIHVNFGANELAGALQKSGACWLIADQTARGRDLESLAHESAGAAGLRGVTVQPGGDGRLDLDAVLAPGATAPAPQGAPDLPLCLQFTSGSTGRPKAVVLSGRALMQNAAMTADAAGLRAGDRFAVPLPLFHSAGLSTGLVLSAVVDLWWVAFHRFEAGKVLETLSGDACTAFVGVPTMYRALRDEMDRRAVDLPALRTGLIGGAFLPPDLCRESAARLSLDHLAMVYGQTESGPTVSVTRPGDPQNRRYDTAGPPLPGVDVRIADPDTGAVLPPGATGEIQAQGPTMMSGYFGDPEATAAAFTGDGWLRTGDLGRLVDGKIQVAGRLKELIIRGGENLSPWEIEEAMRHAPGVADVCAIPAPSEHWGEEICAVVASNAGIDESVLRDHAAAALPRHMRPDQYRIVEALPLLANGKVDRVALMADMTQETGDA